MVDAAVTSESNGSLHELHIILYKYSSQKLNMYHQVCFTTEINIKYEMLRT